MCIRSPAVLDFLFSLDLASPSHWKQASTPHATVFPCSSVREWWAQAFCLYQSSLFCPLTRLSVVSLSLVSPRVAWFPISGAQILTKTGVRTFASEHSGTGVLKSRSMIKRKLWKGLSIFTSPFFCPLKECFVVFCLTLVFEQFSCWIFQVPAKTMHGASPSAAFQVSPSPILSAGRNPTDLRSWQLNLPLLSALSDDILAVTSEI